MRPERVLVLGCGSVAQCTLPLLIRDLGIDPQRITIVDMVDNRARIADSIALGVTFEQDQVTPENIDAFLSARVGQGDLLLDLAWNIDNPTILQWCRDHGVRYLNTSVEVWDPYDDLASTHPLDRTLYVRHMDLRRMIARWGDNNGRHRSARARRQSRPRQSLHQAGAHRDRRRRCCATGWPTSATALEQALADENYATLAMLTGTKVIHIAERDTQITDVPKAGRRVRQHLVGRRLLRGGHRARRARLGHAREAAAAQRLRPSRLRPAQPDLHRPDRAWRRGCARGCRPARSAAWSSATARR